VPRKPLRFERARRPHARGRTVDRAAIDAQRNQGRPFGMQLSVAIEEMTLARVVSATFALRRITRAA